MYVSLYMCAYMSYYIILYKNVAAAFFAVLHGSFIMPVHVLVTWMAKIAAIAPSFSDILRRNISRAFEKGKPSFGGDASVKECDHAVNDNGKLPCTKFYQKSCPWSKFLQEGGHQDFLEVDFHDP